MQRRRFVQAAAALGFAGHFIGGRDARAAGWAELPTADADYWPIGAQRDYKVFELHLAGGLSHYETFHVMTALGATDQWFGARAQVEAVNWSGCGADRPTSPTETRVLQGSIALGPATKPLWPFVNQMRVIVMEHDLEPHEVAIPLSLTGLKPGNPKFAGLGAAIEHRADTSRTPRAQPFSYVLMPANLSIDEDSFQGMHAAGFHGGQSRPLLIRMPALPPGATSAVDQRFLDSLARSTGLIDNNPLLWQYAAQYRDRLRHHVLPGTASRAGEFQAYEAALASVLNAPQLQSTLTSALQPVQNLTACVDGAGTPAGNMTAAAIRTAARLLGMAEADGGARYVGVVDGGIRATAGGGYDIHGASAPMFTNLWNAMSELAAVLHRPAAGVTPDPNKINLNDTVVLLNTEFGRTPEAGGSGGRDHWPKGYVNVILGGPVVQGVAGELDADGLAVTRGGASPVHPYSAADVHAAMLMAAGIDPFDSFNFGVGDMGDGVRADGGGAEHGVARAIRRQILGF